MKRTNQKLQSTIARLRALVDSGALEREYAEKLARAVRTLDHEIQRRNRKGIWKAVDDIARLFLAAK